MKEYEKITQNELNKLILKAQKLEELEDNEPFDGFSDEYDEWEDKYDETEELIEEVSERLSELKEQKL